MLNSQRCATICKLASIKFYWHQNLIRENIFPLLAFGQFNIRLDQWTNEDSKPLNHDLHIKISFYILSEFLSVFQSGKWAQLCFKSSKAWHREDCLLLPSFRRTLFPLSSGSNNSKRILDCCTPHWSRQLRTVCSKRKIRLSFLATRNIWTFGL